MLQELHPGSKFTRALVNTPDDKLRRLLVDMDEQDKEKKGQNKAKKRKELK